MSDKSKKNMHIYFYNISHTSTRELSSMGIGNNHCRYLMIIIASERVRQWERSEARALSSGHWPLRHGMQQRQVVTVNATPVRDYCGTALSRPRSKVLSGSRWGHDNTRGTI